MSEVLLGTSAAVPPLSILAHISGVVDIQLSVKHASCLQSDTGSILPPSCVWLEGYRVSRVLFIGFLALCTHQNWLSCQSSPNARRNSATLISDGLVGASSWFPVMAMLVNQSQTCDVCCGLCCCWLVRAPFLVCFVGEEGVEKGEIACPDMQKVVLSHKNRLNRV